MEYNNKTIGKIYDFDGEAGTIITPSKEYIFNIDQIKNTESLSNNSIVAFYPSTLKIGNEIFYIAREIEELEKEKIQDSKKGTR